MEDTKTETFHQTKFWVNQVKSRCVGSRLAFIRASHIWGSSQMGTSKFYSKLYHWFVTLFVKWEEIVVYPV